VSKSLSLKLILTCRSTFKLRTDTQAGAFPFSGWSTTNDVDKRIPAILACSIDNPEKNEPIFYRLF
jgi:hypothetical protein